MFSKGGIGVLDESIRRLPASNAETFETNPVEAKIGAILDGKLVELPGLEPEVLKASMSEPDEGLPDDLRELQRWMRRSRNEHDSKNRVELRKELVRFAKSDAEAAFEDPEDGLTIGFIVMADEISRMIGTTEFSPDALRRINFSLRRMLSGNIEKMRSVWDADKMGRMIEEGLSDESKLAELLNIRAEEFSQLEHRDKLMIRDAISVYMRDFWKRYGELLSTLPKEDKIAG